MTAFEDLETLLATRLTRRVTQGLACHVLAFPGTSLFAWFARFAASERAPAVFASCQARLLFARQAFASAGQSTFVTASRQNLTANFSASFVHESRHALPTCSLTRVTAVQNDPT